MVKNLSWRRYEDEFQQLADKIHSGEINEAHDINRKLATICGPVAKVQGVYLSQIAFIEFLFFRAQGPYSFKFQKYSIIIEKVMQRSPRLRRLLSNSAAHALGNMVLDGRGKLKFPLSDFQEFQGMLEFWGKCRIETPTPRKIYDAILEKKGIRERIHSGDPALIIRLVKIFPMYEDEIIPEGFDYDSLIGRISDPSNEYYEDIIQDYSITGRTLDDIIGIENNRERKSSLDRNLFLAYLVKKRHEFKCQICTSFLPVKTPSAIEVHHIVPISEEGADRSENMLVTCRFHHKEIHMGRISVEATDQIMIHFNGKTCILDRN